MTIGQKIKEYRQAKGMTQRELALLTNITRGYLNRVESGTVNISLTKMQTISDVLGVDKNSILSGEALPSKNANVDEQLENKILVLIRELGIKLPPECKELFFEHMSNTAKSYIKALEVLGKEQKQ